MRVARHIRFNRKLARLFLASVMDQYPSTLGCRAIQGPGIGDIHRSFRAEDAKTILLIHGNACRDLRHDIAGELQYGRRPLSTPVAPRCAAAFTSIGSAKFSPRAAPAMRRDIETG